MKVLEMHLNGRTIGRFGDPGVKVLAFSGFEEENIVARVEISEFVELVEFGFRVELGVFARMGKERVEVVDEMAMARFVC